MANRTGVLAAAAQVYDHPRRPAHHESDFLSTGGDRVLGEPDVDEDRGEIQGHSGIER